MGYFDYEKTLLFYLENMRNQLQGKPLNLGGVAGTDGGGGGPPGGFVGYLPQRRVCYDTTEAATLATTGSGTLIDNLNHIRYRLNQIEAVASALSVKDNGFTVSSGVTVINFTGGATVVEDTPGEVTVTISGSSGPGGEGVIVKEDGTVVASGITTLNFVGLDVVQTNSTSVTVSAVAASGVVASGSSTGYYGSVLCDITFANSTTNSYTVSSIPADCNVLEIIYEGQTDATGLTDVGIQFNGDTTDANYYGACWEFAPGDINVYADAIDGAWMGYLCATGNTACQAKITIANYSGTTFYKIAQFTIDNHNALAVLSHMFGHETWKSTAAITSLKFFLLDSGAHFKLGSRLLVIAYKNHT